MLGEVELADLDPGHATASAACWALPQARGHGMITTSLAAVLRFGFAALDLQRVEYEWAEGNTASQRVAQRVAQRCGFTVEGRRRSAWLDGDRHVDIVVTGRLAADR